MFVLKGSLDLNADYFALLHRLGEEAVERVDEFLVHSDDLGDEYLLETSSIDAMQATGFLSSLNFIVVVSVYLRRDTVYFLHLSYVIIYFKRTIIFIIFTKLIETFSGTPSRAHSNSAMHLCAVEQFV